MKSSFFARLFSRKPEPASGAAMDDSPALFVAEESHLMKTVGWISAAVGAVALGLFVGRELRQRYKFNRRTPYDFYSHSGDFYTPAAGEEFSDADFGLGI